uniref:Uncharacterized protein n=1 Tax=Florenciella sp. virus SA2 TaxID=3240092 RepID=A0AB39J7N0_9VIRU
MSIHKIGLLIPCTSKNRNWTNIKETYLYNLTLKTFLLTSNKEHNYIFYIGIDKNDHIFDNSNYQQEIIKFTKVFKNVEFKFIYMDEAKKGHLTKMWNILFRRAYDENCEYFFQCGDDMIFATNGWVNDCIEILKKHKGFGLTGPINNNNRILTQAFVSRRHMEIFGWFFPEEIMNWCCDDWYNFVYAPQLLFPLIQHFCDNKGGEPRYNIDGNINFMNNGRENVTKLREKTMALAQKHRLLIHNKLRNIK